MNDLSEMEVREPTSKAAPSPPEWNIQSMGQTQDGGLQIYVFKPVLEEIIEYSKTNLTRELGGWMFGGYFEQDGTSYIEIDSYIKAELGESKHASFKFTHDSWSQMRQIQEERFPDKLMVGWHHTHPQFGLFLSSMDMFIHNNFFDLSFHVALVVDPCADELAFFQWQDKTVVDCGFHLVTPTR